MDEMTSPGRRCGFVGVDVDSLRHYYPARASGSPGAGRSSCNIVWDRAVPRYLELFDGLGISATFFIVGEDLETPTVRQRVREIVVNGHEVANHSYSHPRSLNRLSFQDKEAEIVGAEAILEQVSGTAVKGFRAPSWCVDEQILSLLESRGYLYDSSIMPSSLVPLLKVVYWLKSRGQLKPADLLGRLRHATAPLEPYSPNPERIESRGAGSLVELPIAVVPYLRLPFWATVHLAVGSWAFFSFCYQLLHKSLRSLHYQCHAVDLLDSDNDDVPSQFRRMFGLQRPLCERRSLLERILTRLTEDYEMAPARELAANLDRVVDGLNRKGAAIRRYRQPLRSQ